MKDATPKAPASAPAASPSAPAAATKSGQLMASLKSLNFADGHAALAPKGGPPPAAGPGGFHHGADELDLNVKDRLRGAVGQSTTYSRIRDLLGQVPTVTKLEDREALMLELNQLCRDWLGRHADDPKRGPIIQAIARDADHELDVIAGQRVAESRTAAEHIYLQNVQHAHDPSSPHALEALSGQGQLAAAGVGAGPADQAHMANEGLTEAEIAAIKIFTASDYSYINPATANAPGWLASQKAKPEFGIGHMADRTLMQEGSLHTAVAMQGLKKLKPYTAPTYRGARYTRAEFAEQFVVGKTLDFNSLSSSAQHEAVAAGFASGATTEAAPAADKVVAVISELHGTNGRDINDLSVVQGEAEVLILPGTKLVIQSVTRITNLSKYQGVINQAAAMGRPAAAEWYLAKLAPAPQGATGAAPASPTASPAASPATAPQGGATAPKKPLPPTPPKAPPPITPKPLPAIPAKAPGKAPPKLPAGPTLPPPGAPPKKPLPVPKAAAPSVAKPPK